MKSKTKKPIKELPEQAVKLLFFIASFKSQKDYSPSNREMGDAIGMTDVSGKKWSTSTSVVDYYLQRLQGRGLLEVERFQSRTARLTVKGKEFVRDHTLPMIPRRALRTRQAIYEFGVVN